MGYDELVRIFYPRYGEEVLKNKSLMCELSARNTALETTGELVDIRDSIQLLQDEKGTSC